MNVQHDYGRDECLYDVRDRDYDFCDDDLDASDLHLDNARAAGDLHGNAAPVHHSKFSLQFRYLDVLRENNWSFFLVHYAYDSDFSSSRSTSFSDLSTS
ncbi:hypothetical protein [Brevibacillus laterosporus]|uniref:hypothetical protein n=1 Tax=Brevibacillus laterosporus TaxID=1465 RepID=UPI0020D1363B|nr:hypothetical protein [Brevibacillus laterosporus]